MKKKKSFKSCYLIAPFRKTKKLIELLQKHEIKTNDELIFSDSTWSLSNNIEEGIRKADFVCAYIPSKPNNNIFFEMGIARGLKKPIFLIIEEKENLDIYLQDMVYVIASIEDENAIEFALDQFLNNYRQTFQHLRSDKVAKEKFDTESFKHKLKMVKSSTELECFLVELFENLDGVTVAKKDKYANKGIDMALWVDKLEYNLGNPVLVELKNYFSFSMLSNAENQLRQYLNKTNSNLGLLIYVNKDICEIKKPKIKKPMVIWLELHDLVQKLSESSLAEIIINERNEMLHGYGE